MRSLIRIRTRVSELSMMIKKTLFVIQRRKGNLLSNKMSITRKTSSLSLKGLETNYNSYRNRSISIPRTPRSSLSMWTLTRVSPRM